MAREQELQQQKPSHTATSRQKPRQTSLLKIRQFVTEHRHQEASAQERRRRGQRERIHRVKHKSMHKAQNKGSTSNPSVATTKSLRMVLGCIAVHQQHVGTNRHREQNSIPHSSCDQ